MSERRVRDLTEEDKKKAWPAVVRGKYLALKRLMESEAINRAYVIQECESVLNHRFGCPEDLRGDFERWRAWAKGWPIV